MSESKQKQNSKLVGPHQSFILHLKSKNGMSYGIYLIYALFLWMITSETHLLFKVMRNWISRKSENTVNITRIWRRCFKDFPKAPQAFKGIYLLAISRSFRMCEKNQYFHVNMTRIWRRNISGDFSAKWAVIEHFTWVTKLWEFISAFWRVQERFSSSIRTEVTLKNVEVV